MQQNINIEFNLYEECFECYGVGHKGVHSKTKELITCGTCNGKRKVLTELGKQFKELITDAIKSELRSRGILP